MRSEAGKTGSRTGKTREIPGNSTWKFEKTEKILRERRKFKLEMGNLNAFATFEEAIEAVHHRIHYHNRKRIHSALRMPPALFRERYFLMEKERLRTDVGASEV